MQQDELQYLGLRKLFKLTGAGLSNVSSPNLDTLDLRGSLNVTTDGRCMLSQIIETQSMITLYFFPGLSSLVQRCRKITRLILTGLTNIDNSFISNVVACLGDSLVCELTTLVVIIALIT